MRHEAETVSAAPPSGLPSVPEEEEAEEEFDLQRAGRLSFASLQWLPQSTTEVRGLAVPEGMHDGLHHTSLYGKQMCLGMVQSQKVFMCSSMSWFPAARAGGQLFTSPERGQRSTSATWQGMGPYYSVFLSQHARRRQGTVAAGHLKSQGQA
jgi:hypothetical protein